MELNSQYSPPRQQVLLSHDSPIHAKRVHNSRSYQSGQLEDARLVVLEELGTRIPQITLQDFMDFLAPPLPEFDIQTTMEKLKTSGILTALGRWKAFDKEPKDQSGREDAAFKPIPDIFNATVAAIIENSNSNLI